MEKIFLYILLFILTGINSYSQEINIPADTSGKIFVITSELSSKLGIFKEYEYFQEARLFKIDDSNYFLEINYKSNDLMVRKRINYNQSQLDSFRLDFSKKLASMETIKPLDQSGRLPLVVTSTILGLGFWGWALPTTFEVDDETLFTGLYLLTAGASFALPYYLTMNSEIPKAVGTYSSYGGLAGIAHGMFLFDFINGGISNASSNSVIGTILFSSISEMIINYIIAKNQNFTSGKASTMISTSVFGTFLGLAITDFLNLYDTPRLWSGVTLATTGLGYLAGDILTQKQSYSEGDATVLTASGLLGAALPISLIALTESSDSKTYSIAGSIGACVGLWLGNYITSDVDFESSHGDYIFLGTLGGALIGAGIGVMITSGDKRNSIPLFTTAGGITGFSALYFSFKGKSPKGSMSSIKLQFNPIALTYPLLIKNDNNPSIPFLQLQFNY